MCNKSPLNFNRYLDDIFLIWPHAKDDFIEFLLTPNSQDPNIKLKANISDSSVDFLDLTVYKGTTFNPSSYLDHKVYSKPTDSHQLLHKESVHPPHTFEGLVKSQIIRFHRDSSDKSLNSACSTVFHTLKTRGYSTRQLWKIKADTL
jgi:hypothetical protein